jgi:hypothetical protein
MSFVFTCFLNDTINLYINCLHFSVGLENYKYHVARTMYLGRKPTARRDWITTGTKPRSQIGSDCRCSRSSLRCSRGCCLQSQEQLVCGRSGREIRLAPGKVAPQLPRLRKGETPKAANRGAPGTPATILAQLLFPALLPPEAEPEGAFHRGA